MARSKRARVHIVFSLATLGLHACASKSPAAPAPVRVAAPQQTAKPPVRPGDPPRPAAHAHSGHHEHDFSDVEKYIERFEGAKRDAWQRPAEVLRLLRLSLPKLRVADLGAGTGYFLPHLSEAVADGTVIALDVEPNMVAYMQERVRSESLSNVTARVSPPDGPGLASRSVDRILIVNTWHHLPSRKTYSRALGNALDKGGFVLVIDFEEGSPFGPPAQARVPLATVVHELTAGGLIAMPVPEKLPHQYAVLAIKPPGPDPAHRPKDSRQAELVDIINANTGLAHMTRGVNRRTLEALKAALKPNDKPHLRSLLYNQDDVVVMACAMVLSARGASGISILMKVAADSTLSDKNKWLISNEIQAATIHSTP